MVSFFTKILFYVLWHDEWTSNLELSMSNSKQFYTLSTIPKAKLHYSEPKQCVLSKKTYEILSFKKK
jgi:hypothetical protein